MHRTFLTKLFILKIWFPIILLLLRNTPFIEPKSMRLLTLLISREITKVILSALGMETNLQEATATISQYSLFCRKRLNKYHINLPSCRRGNTPKICPLASQRIPIFSRSMLDIFSSFRNLDIFFFPNIPFG